MLCTAGHVIYVWLNDFSLPAASVPSCWMGAAEDEKTASSLALFCWRPILTPHYSTVMYFVFILWFTLLNPALGCLEREIQRER